ncbi:MAG TPA: RNA polymerase sigma factor [Holophaga sp.]|jgi:RNA polymerase sigma-70 factor (ECF subfamily)|nr:RNA polymerase sigma factor [Holophaga sp.]
MSFDALHADLRPKVVNYLARFVGQGEAEDLAQDVFIRVHQGMDGFRAQAKLSTWVFQIATNAALDRLKSASHRASQAQVDERALDDSAVHFLPAHDQQALKEEMCSCIRGLVDDLPVDSRTIIYLSELKELQIREIAEILEITPGAAKIRLHRARQCLKGQMEKHCRIILDEWAELQCDRKPLK